MQANISETETLTQAKSTQSILLEKVFVHLQIIVSCGLQQARENHLKASQVAVGGKVVLEKSQLMWLKVCRISLSNTVQMC